MAKNYSHKVMSVGELKDYLATLPQDAPIVLSCDEEGNSFSPLTRYGIGGIVTFNKQLSGALEEGEKGIDALVLYPN